MHFVADVPLSYIAGKTTNNCKNELSTVYVEFSLNDESGNQVGYGNDMTSHLAAGQIWAFKVKDTENAARWS